jgi:hypothetical protein
VCCRHRDLRANGDFGLVIRVKTPSVVFIDGTKGGRRVGWQMRHYPATPLRCAGRQVEGG